MFPSLEFLSIEGLYEKLSRDATIAISDFLKCYPVIHEPRLKLCMHPSFGYHNERLDQLHFKRSMDRFRKHKIHFDDDDGDDNCCDVSKLAGLKSERVFIQLLAESSTDSEITI